MSTFYRLNTPIMGIANVDGRDIVVTVPAQALLTCYDPLPDSPASPPVEVYCSGKPVKMFPIDIKERAYEILSPFVSAG